jgi:hypothetical protein|tara:strand:+ start:1047 stop:1382 length:336 start_codon:yes stop_codon:yes gene_type:complete
MRDQFGREESDRFETSRHCNARARFGDQALGFARASEAETEGKQKKRLLDKAIESAIASGVARFQAGVSSGSLSRALPLDAARSVILALEVSGFKVTRDSLPLPKVRSNHL